MKDIFHHTVAWLFIFTRIARLELTPEQEEEITREIGKITGYENFPEYIMQKIQRDW